MQNKKKQIPKHKKKQSKTISSKQASKTKTKPHNPPPETQHSQSHTQMVPGVMALTIQAPAAGWLWELNEMFME